MLGIIPSKIKVSTPFPPPPPPLPPPSLFENANIKTSTCAVVIFLGLVSNNYDHALLPILYDWSTVTAV